MDESEQTTAPPFPSWIIRVLLGGLLVVTGITKVLEPAAFLKLVHEYDFLPATPPYWINATAILVPWTEILLGLLLVSGTAVRGAATLAFLILMAFTIAIVTRAWHIHQTTDLAWCSIAFDCGCGLGKEAFCRKLPTNLALMLAAVTTWATRGGRYGLRPTLSRSSA